MSWTMPALNIDRTSSVPLQRQILDGLRRLILDGTLRPGTRLPPTRELARDLGVSRNSVVKAFDYLSALGLIHSRTGAGTRVAERPPPFRNRIHLSTRPIDLKRSPLITRLIPDIHPGTPGAFRPGIPAVDHFPMKLWRTVVSGQLRSVPATLMGYDDRTGQAVLREAVAEFLAVFRGVRCDAGQVIIVSGAQQAVDLTARVLLEPGDEVWFEDPGYPGARAALASTGATIVPVPVDDQGLDVAEGTRRAPSARLAYVTPSHQYPLGATMSASRRSALLRWARESGGWIIEDDYDSDFRYAGRQLSSLQGMDTAQCVIYIGTFSKCLAPGVRIGFIVSPPDLVDAFSVARSIAGRGIPALDQLVLAEFLDGGHLARHIRALNAVYLERQQALIRRLRERVPELQKISGTNGGMHLVAFLQQGIDDRQLSQAGLSRGVDLIPLRAYEMVPRNAPALVLGYGSITLAEIEKGVEHLRAAIADVRAGSDAGRSWGSSKSR